MGGIIDPGQLASIAGSLHGNHTLREALNRLKLSMKYAGGPFSTNAPSGATSRLGAAPRVGTFHAGSGYEDAFNQVIGLGGVLGQYLQQANDPMTQLYNQLLDQLQNPVAQPGMIDKNDLMNQVKAALNPIYDQRVNAATSQTKQQTADVSALYKQLNQDYKDLAPVAAQNAVAAQNQIKDMYGELRSNIEGTYARVSQEQGDLFKQLGIESALPDTLNKQNPSVMDALTAASENQAQQQQAYMDRGQADQTFYNEQAPIATMQGIETNKDLMSQLNTYVNQINAERASGIQSGYLDQLGQAQNFYLQQQQLAQNQQNQNNSMLWDILSTQMKNNSQSLTPDTLMAQLPPNLQQAVASAFTQLQRSPEAIYGKVEDPRNPVPGTYVNTTPEWYYAQADQLFKSGAIDAQTHQALLEYLQLYFGGK